MKIIIELSFLKDVNLLINDIYEKHRNKIKEVKKIRREICLINGDVIKIISANGNTIDGLRADVAIGPHAEIITITSNQDKKIWGFNDLENHLKNI